MKKYLFFLLFIALFSLKSYSQFSKTHYIPPIGSSTIAPGSQYLYISTPNTAPVNFKIIELGGNIIVGTVSKNTPYIYTIGYGSYTQLNVDAAISSSVLNNKGYIIEAEDLVYVSARMVDTTENHAGEIVSKGKASLGKRFRIGALTNLETAYYSDIHATFVSVLATENNTTVNFSNIKPGTTIVNRGSGSNPFSITLNSGQSYVMLVQGPNNANRDGLIGALVTSDKPISLNCGSMGGTNAVANLDLGFDQIVPAERIETNEYIFIKSTGIDSVEKVLLIADEDDTEIIINDNVIPPFTINAGEYLILNGSYFNASKSLYVKSNKRVFAYQAIGDNGAIDQRNQEMFFVPPLSCQTPRVIDNIPQINYVGNRQFFGRVTIVTQTGATLNFTVNNTDYTINSLPFFVSGPNPVTGNPDYETYVITGISGNVSVYSSGEIYLAAYGSESAATFGGYYSGFTFEPEISLSRLDPTQTACISNTVLSVNTLSPFDTFQWYFNGNPIPGATSNTYTPSTLGAGYYKVSATISNCTAPKESSEIPVSSCPTDGDGDGINDNIDIDNDNDGITNCTESYGDVNVDLTNPIGWLQIGDYTNLFISPVSSTGTPVVGDVNGNFITETAIGKGNTKQYAAGFNNPISLAVEYASLLNNPNDAFSDNTEISISCPPNKTLTILNPDNQLLIDTNYDGVFESGVTQFSSFDIRFRLNNSVALTPQNSTFSIRGHLINVISVTNTNLSDTEVSRIALKLIATCVPKDSDGDGIPDQLDYDSDNDGIPDLYEGQGANFMPLNPVDSNGDGLFDQFGNGIIPIDTDGDGIPDYLDLDSDNDGIFDIIESGSSGNQNNTNGIMVGNFGTNGLHNSLETSPNSGTINYTIADSDNDGIFNYIELDSDNDGCFDTIEAGFEDNNNDGILGSDVPTNINLLNGLVISSTGYTVPNQNYTIGAPISITTQPINVTVCELQTAVFTIDSPAVDSYRWQLSTDNETTWSNITNNTTYSGATTASLTVSNVSPTMVGYKYRVFLNRIGNSCGLYSEATILTTYALPVVTTPITLKQCDVDTDGISDFNLTQINDLISANIANETITYFTSQIAAENQVATDEITNPIVYNAGTSTVFARVENANGCYRVSQINLVVSVSQIPPSFIIQDKHLCDDYLDATNDDRDGISGPFDFTNIKNNLQAILPSTVTISFYKSEADFLAETDANGNSLAIVDIANYRNIGYPNSQTIWVRVDSTLDNSCFGYKTFDIIVNPLPEISLKKYDFICLPNSEVTFDAGIIDGTSPANYTYQWYQDGNLLVGKTNYLFTAFTDGTYSVTVTNSSGCSRTREVVVVGSEAPTLADIVVQDLTDVNTILVNVTGSGDFEYALNDGSFQKSNFFTNVPFGLHSIYAKDAKGCGMIGPIQAVVLGIPKYFTPNNDGFHDTWNVKGVTAFSNSNSVIRIFDRYGKLLKQISPLSNGWDGTFNGKQMPADDYWYSIQFEDGRNTKGHFSLKR